MRKVQVRYRDYEGQNFCHVADVEVPDDCPAPLEYTFRVTQNIEGSWSRGEWFEDGTKNADHQPTVSVVAPLLVSGGVTYGHRSSMVGDRFVLDGKTFEVAWTGFREIVS